MNEMGKGNNGSLAKFKAAGSTSRGAFPRVPFFAGLLWKSPKQS
jgi:hypothetical protein